MRFRIWSRWSKKLSFKFNSIETRLNRTLIDWMRNWSEPKRHTSELWKNCPRLIRKINRMREEALREQTQAEEKAVSSTSPCTAKPLTDQARVTELQRTATSDFVESSIALTSNQKRFWKSMRTRTLSVEFLDFFRTSEASAKDLKCSWKTLKLSILEIFKSCITLWMLKRKDEFRSRRIKSTERTYCYQK